MALQYAMPKVGETFSENDLNNYADAEGYDVNRIGNNNEDGGLLLTLNKGGLIGISFLLTDIGSTEPYKRVY